MGDILAPGALVDVPIKAEGRAVFPLAPQSLSSYMCRALSPVAASAASLNASV